MSLTQQQMRNLLEEAPPKKVGEVDFECPNPECGRTVHADIEEHAWEVDETGKLYYDCPHAFTTCKCGAGLIVAWQPSGETELYWINKEKMTNDRPSE